MLRLSCPTGCQGFIRRPHALRAQPIRCGNCRAWLAAPEQAEDGSLVYAILLARPGEALPEPRSSGRGRRWWRAVVAVAALAVALLFAALELRR